MNTKVVILIVALALFSLADAKEGKGKGKGKGKGGKGMMKKCKGEDIKWSDASKEAMKTCKEENKGEKSDDEDSSEKKKNWMKKMACFSACVMEKTKKVVDGKIDNDAVNKWVEETFPSSVQSSLKDELKKCSDASDGKLSKDDNCKTYGTYSKCQRKAMKTACKSDKDDDKDDA